MSAVIRNLLTLVLTAILFVACQHDDRRFYNYPDAVTNINQVDPAYRAYFRAQNGRNFSVADQRKALVAAVKTSRTPVPKYAPRVVASKAKKRYSRSRVARYSKSNVRRGKVRSGHRYVASRTKKRRAIASRGKRRRR